MTLFHSLILGLVEGFTEFLPISSTAHLILVSDILRIDQSLFVKSFEITIQAGAILAVIVMYWKRLWDVAVIKKLIAAFIPTAIIGFVLYKFIKQYLIGNTAVVLWSLAIGGAILIALEKFVFKKKEGAAAAESSGSMESAGKGIEDLSYAHAALIGVAQAVAVIPGVSRSAATIVGGLLAGMSRRAVVEFSFLLAVPTILAASAYDLLKNAGSFSVDQTGTLVVGFLAAFATALVGIRFLLSYVRGRSFTGFGWYRIAIVVLFLLFAF